MARSRTSEADLGALALADLAIALDAAGLSAELRGRTLHVTFDNTRTEIEVVTAAYATEPRADELIRDRAPNDAVPVLVADRITSDARVRLSEAKWGWFDRRGHLNLRAPGLLINAEVPPSPRAEQTSDEPIRGRAGLAVAYRLLIDPNTPLSPTRSSLGLAPSTISVAISRLRAAGLVDANGLPVLPELFWALAEQWTPARTWLAVEPNPSEAKWHDPQAPGWCVSGTVAAAELGAPVVSTTSIPDLYVPGPVAVTIASRRYGLAPDPTVAAASIAAAPVADITAHRRAPNNQAWPLAHPVAVALDLAQDRSRGREILEDWTPIERVW
jgi:hypothetical protein